MEDLIEALQIFATGLKDKNYQSPINCMHDTMFIMEAHKDTYTKEQFDRLLELVFLWDDEEEYFYSFKFGSA